MTDAVVTQVQQPADTSRRKFLVGATTALSTVGAVGVATPFVASWQPSAKAKAAGAPVKVDISKILPGEQIRAEWRGKPVFVLRRTPEMLESLKANSDRVADPKSEKPQQPSYATNEARSINPEIAVLLLWLPAQWSCAVVFGCVRRSSSLGAGDAPQELVQVLALVLEE